MVFEQRQYFQQVCDLNDKAIMKYKNLFFVFQVQRPHIYIPDNLPEKNYLWKKFSVQTQTWNIRNLQTKFSVRTENWNTYTAERLNCNKIL